MKKEIKFRAWDTVDYMSTPFTLMDIQNGQIQFTSDCVIMQFTGLQDRNGKEIYEGDILSYDYSDHLNPYPEERKKLPCYIVKYDDNNNFLLGGFGLDKNRLYCHSSRFKYAEVLGNIYETPELNPNKTTA